MHFSKAAKCPLKHTDIDNLVLPKPKLLKSCIRCRKHKIKCDAFTKSPNPCSSCEKKKISCKIDYVLPPQRSDNLKDLIYQVDFIRNEVDQLNTHYTNLCTDLKLQLPSFEEWRLQQNLVPVQESTNNSGDDDSEETHSYTLEDNLNLIKLSDGRFVSMNLQLNNDLLIIEQEEVSISQFQHRLTLCLKNLNLFTGLFECGDESSYGAGRWFDLGFSVQELFKKNKFQLLILVKFFYPHIRINFERFMTDYLSSYYNIINQLNQSLHTSTYSSNLNIMIMNKSSNILKSNVAHDLKQTIVFNKEQLCSLLNVEIFNSEFFLKKLLQLLFLNTCLNGVQQLSYVNELITFIKLNINNNRKRLNFEKNVDLKFIENFTSILNKILCGYEDINVSDPEREACLHDETPGSPVYVLNEVVLQLIELEKYQKCSTHGNESLSSSVNIKEESQVTIPTLFGTNNNNQSSIKHSPVLKPSHKFNSEIFTTQASICFNKLETFLSYMQLDMPFINRFLLELSMVNLQVLNKLKSNHEITAALESITSQLLSVSSNGIFTTPRLQKIVESVNKLQAVDSSIFTTPPFKPIKVEEAGNYHYVNEDLISSIPMSSSHSVSSHSSISPMTEKGADVHVVTLTHLSNLEERTISERSAVQGDGTVMFVQSGEQFEGDEIRDILEGVDWKKETTEDVLKKMGVRI